MDADSGPREPRLHAFINDDHGDIIEQRVCSGGQQAQATLGAGIPQLKQAVPGEGS